MNTSTLLLGVIFSSIGLGYFMYGRKQRAGAPLLCGLALMIYPYFTSSIGALLALGIVLAALPWLLQLRR
ncbi:MAG: hypothetical protein ABIO38_01005 [Luteimonas sp.]